MVGSKKEGETSREWGVGSVCHSEMGSTTVLDTLGHALPPPCPSECIDMLPSDMWAAYWARSRDGTAQLPASLPWRLSEAQSGQGGAYSAAARRWRQAHGGALPKIWKGHWGKFFVEGQPRVGGDEMGDDFWSEYVRRHPDGQWEDPTPTSGMCDAGKGWDARRGQAGDDKCGYIMIRGVLYYRHPTNLGILYRPTENCFVYRRDR